jgi:hypothetical protein
MLLALIFALLSLTDFPTGPAFGRNPPASPSPAADIASMCRRSSARMERADDGDTAKHIGENEDDTPNIDRAIVETADKAGDADAREANRYKQHDGNEKSSPHETLSGVMVWLCVSLCLSTALST